jgi:hypothetical protein
MQQRRDGNPFTILFPNKHGQELSTCPLLPTSTLFSPCMKIPKTLVVGVLDEPYSQITPLSGVAVQARHST